MKQQMQTDIGPRLKKYRVERDLTLEALGILIGANASTVYRIENELVEPNERTVYRIEKLPGFPVNGSLGS